MSPVKVAPAPGQTIVEETRTRVEPSAQPQEPTDNEPRVPMWEFMEQITLEQWGTQRYEITLYRGRKHERDKTWIGKFYEPMPRERIQREYGGGWYTIFFKIPVKPNSTVQTLKYSEDFSIIGAPKEYVEPAAAPAAGDANSQLIAMFRDEMRALREEFKQARGGDAASTAVTQAVQLSGQVFGAATNAAAATLARMNEGGGNNNGGGLGSGILDKLLTVAIDRMLNPADPFEQFGKMMAAAKQMGLGGGGREASLTTELVRSIAPQISTLGAYAASMMDNYRRAKEAEMQAALVARGQSPQHLPPSPMPQPSASAAPSGDKVIEMPAPQPPNPEDMMKDIEQQLVKLLCDMTMPPEDVANQILAYMDTKDATIVDQIAAHGEGGLRWVFQNRAIITEGTRALPPERITAFIRAFIDGAKRVDNAPPSSLPS